MQQLQDAVPHQLQLAQLPRTGVEFQRAIPPGPSQLGSAGRIDQLALQLTQQGCRLPRAGKGGEAGGIDKQVRLLARPQLALAGALQQLLKLRPQPPEAGLQPPRLGQPVRPEGLAQRHGIAEQGAAAGAVLPEVGTGREQVQLHRHAATERVQQLHLHRSHAAEAEQAQAGGQLGAGVRVPLQPFHGLPHPQPEGLHPQLLAQLPHQQGLPVAALVQPLPPLAQQVGAVEGVVVEGIGDAAAQLPLGQPQLLA